MKNLFLVTLLSLIPMISFAKHDFNALISDSNFSQKKISKQLQDELKVRNKDAPRARIVVVEEGHLDRVSKTKKSMLIFNKEKHQHALTNDQKLHRVANEFSKSE